MLVMEGHTGLLILEVWNSNIAHHGRKIETYSINNKAY